MKTDHKVFIAVALIIGFLLGFIAGKSAYTNDVEKIMANITSGGTNEAAKKDSQGNTDDAAKVGLSKVEKIKAEYEGINIFNGSATETPYIGNADATVTVTEYSDYQCPFCATFYKKTLPAILSQYVKKGLVKFEYKDFPLGGHINAVPAAIATHCAGEQQAFWYMHSMLFENQSDWGRQDPDLVNETLLGYAKELGLDEEKFSECQDSDVYNQKIQADFNEGVKLGVDATPSFNINGELIIGAEKYAKFDQVIKSKLSVK